MEIIEWDGEGLILGEWEKVIILEVFVDGDIIFVCKSVLMVVEFVFDGEVFRLNFEDFLNSGVEMFLKLWFFWIWEIKVIWGVNVIFFVGMGLYKCLL